MVMTLLLGLVLLLGELFAGGVSAQIISGQRSGGVSIGTGTEVPATCTPGTSNPLFLDTDDEVLYVCTATDTFTASSGSSPTLDQAFDGGKVIDGANSFPNSMCVGATLKLCFYEDATLGPLIRPSTDANTRTYIWANFTWCVYDVEGTSCMLTVDPDATDNDKYVWASGYRPIKTISFTADALYPRGASTLVTDTALVSGGLISPYITITDSDSDGFYRYIGMDPKWDGGPVTATVHVVNVNATPANAFEVDVSGACYPAGTVIPTTIPTTGEQAATVSFGASGSCGGSACNQNDPASATTAAITINGTPAGGNFCGFQAQVDATATTETVAGIKITQMDIHYKISKGF